LYLVFGVIEPLRTNKPAPGLCYPAKDQRELAAECRRLQSMLLSDERPLPEISSCAHVSALRELLLVKQQPRCICARTERGFYAAHFPDQATL